MAENNLQITFPAPPGIVRFPNPTGPITSRQILNAGRYVTVLSQELRHSTYMLETQDVPMDIDDENGIGSKSSSNESFKTYERRNSLRPLQQTLARITETQDRIIKTQDQPTETLARMTENLDDMAQSQARVETEVKSNTVRLLRVENSLRGDGSVFGYEIRKWLDGSYPLIAIDEVKAYLNGYGYSSDEIDALGDEAQSRKSLSPLSDN
ncbi:hypothetical protein GG344DRAFT_77230 [Lentinula edodes]|nr:hypothetical protein GG344DRAFT_77230 [Lentinula edodes]